jgi:hypothetical protein
MAEEDGDEWRKTDPILSDSRTFPRVQVNECAIRRKAWMQEGGRGYARKSRSGGVRWNGLTEKWSGLRIFGLWVYLLFPPFPPSIELPLFLYLTIFGSSVGPLYDLCGDHD